MEKKGSTAFLLWACSLIAICGLHRFYLQRPWTGLLWLLTFGLLGFGTLFDLFFLGSMVRQTNILNGLRNGGVGSSNTNTNTVAPVFNVHVSVPAGSPSIPAADQPKTISL